MEESDSGRPESFRFSCSSIERKAYFALAKKGFTETERRECWLITSGALQSMYSAPEGYYDCLVLECEKLKTIKCQLPSFHQIKLDMHRTFADEAFFSSKGEQGKLTLLAIERICQSYALRNTQIGYC